MAHRSIDLKKSENEDEEEYDNVGEEGEDELRSMFQKKSTNTWAEGGTKREYVIGKLIKYFGSLVVRTAAVNDEDEASSFQKAPNASINVVRARIMIKEHENMDTKDFTIFIHKRNWIQTEVRPLLELCASENGDFELDKDLALRICRLMLVLVKRLRESTEKSLNTDLRLKYGKESKTEAKQRYDMESASRNNAHEQLSALLSFKEALSSAACARAITVIFEDCLRKEQDESHDTIKQDLATCISYIRRMISIDANPRIFADGDVFQAKKVHNKFIVNNRSILGAMPALCIDIMDKYHDDWFTEIIIILHSLLRNNAAADLFTMWKNRRLLSEAELSSTAPISGQLRPSLKSGGSLSRQLNAERAAKLQSLNSRNRFSGTYRMQNTLNGVDTDQPDTAPDMGLGTNGLLARNPLQGQTVHVQAKRRRIKKSMSFSNNAGASASERVSLDDQTEMDMACAVVATVAEALVASAGLVQLVSRVNEDLRREEERVSLDLELRYFETLSKLLEYNRLKLMDLRKSDSVSGSARWIPNLQNVMKALDKMSFTRVLFTMERLNNKDKRFNDVIIPMKLYNEMLGHINILLLSDDTDHNELAVAALHRLFYCPASERQDPLLRLLSEWKPSVYSRQHMNALVELVGTTLETLQNAKNRFRNRDVGDVKKKKDQTKKNLDIEQYIVACLRFSDNDYFRRVASLHTVDVYTRLLAMFDSNAEETNKSIFEFMWRMCSFQLEQDYETIAPPSVIQPSAVATATATDVSSSTSAKPTLGHLLFNIQTLCVFSQILESRLDGIDLLQRLAKLVVRRFEEASRKNHLVFVELLFAHSHAHDFCLSLDSVYEAPMYASQISMQGAQADTPDAPERNGGSGESHHQQAASAERSAELHRREYDDILGDIFDENDEVNTSSKSSKKSRSQQQHSGGSLTKRREWTAEDDAFLRERYSLYAGSKSVFQLVADDLNSRGGSARKRTAKHVESRVQALRLHMNHADDASESDEEDNELQTAVGHQPTLALEDSPVKRQLSPVMPREREGQAEKRHRIGEPKSRKLLKKAKTTADATSNNDSDNDMQFEVDDAPSKPRYSSALQMADHGRTNQIDSDDDLF